MSDPFTAQNLTLVPQLHHRLVKQAVNITAVGFCDLNRIIKMTQVTHRFVEKAGVQQVHRRMLDTTGVGVNGQPIGRFFRVKRG